ncbi:MAG: LacI family DNA-binding transcriptional regulator [Lentisphaeria bacterium]|nr:LacI family DNA-binding transcriptional regulator [Lentisphaeria bacterium]
MAKVTLKNIAEKAGVSVALVSNYINQRPSARMSAETKQKIDNALKELDYHGSAIARSLRTGRSNIIGYVSESLRTEVAQNEMLAVFDAAAEEKYQVFVAYASAREKTLANIKMLKERGCDAIIVSGYFNDDFSAQICKSFSPVVILNTHESAVSKGKILRYNYRCAVKEAIKYLQSKGHKEIFYQTSLEGSQEQRYLEFVSNFDESKVWYPPHNVPTVQDWRDFMEAHPECSAMLHLNDFMALRTIQLCNAVNMRVPHDLAVVGFDNIHAAECTSPSLASISRPLKEAAQHAVKSLIAQLRNEDYDLPESLPCKFIIRDSI